MLHVNLQGAFDPRPSLRRVVDHPSAMPPLAAVSRILARYDREKVEAFVEVAIGLLDTLDGEPDLEDSGDMEPAGDDQGDQAWIEWQPWRGEMQMTTGHRPYGGNAYEDDEKDDHDEDDDPLDSTGAEDDGCAWFRAMGSGPGCLVSDTDRGDRHE